jgi:flagellar L-ring protein precursor FlgH
MRLRARLAKNISRLLLLFFLIDLTGIVYADSIWKAPRKEPYSLYSTSKGEYEVGDIITILIVEAVTATNSTGTDTEKETNLDMGFQGFDDIFGLTHAFGRPFSADPQLGIDASSDFDGGGSSHRSTAIRGTISGQITEILPNGNLRIEAGQNMLINDEKNSVIVVGTVRPQDISPQNTIYSTQVANAEIHYKGYGPLSTVQKRGVITEVLEFLWPF